MMMSDDGENDLQLQMVDIDDNDDDDRNDHEHDQLPNIEEYKTQIGYKKKATESFNNIITSTFKKNNYKPDPTGANLNNFDVRRYSSSSKNRAGHLNGNGTASTSMNGLTENDANEMDPLHNDSTVAITKNGDDSTMEHLEFEMITTKGRGRRAGFREKLCFGIFAVVTVIAIVLALTVPDNDKNDRKYPWINKSSRRFLALELYLIESGISTEEDLSNVTSPQYYAAQWMANGDGLHLPIPAVSKPTQEVENDSASASAGNSKNDGDNLTKEHVTFIERYAMVTFYFSTDGDNWTNDLNFLTPAHICTWYQDFEIIRDEYNLFDSDFISMGVHGCRWDESNEDLIPYALNMPNNNLVGTIPNEMKVLDRLEDMVFQFNDHLTGSLPTGLSNMNSLHHLALQWCSITGTIPSWIGTMTKLNYLGLGNNLLVGSVPTQLSSLTKLEVLGLDDNDLSGKINVLFATMTNLKSLYIEDNTFTGSISSSLMSNWPTLQELDVSDNDLTGELPTDFFNVENSLSLEVIDLHGNAFTGPLPSYISSYNPDDPAENDGTSSQVNVNDKLKFLAIHNNQFSQQVPESIVSLQSLQHLDISNNKFAGTLSAKIGEMTNLQSFYSGNNYFDISDIPIFLIQLTNLRELSLKRNNLIGTLPTFIHYWSNLEFLDLHFNALTGTIPSKIGLLTNLKHLLLKDNELVGTLPSEMSQLTKLQVLLLEQNKFYGTADEAICNHVIDSHKSTNSSSTNNDNNEEEKVYIPIEYFAADCSPTTSSFICPCCTTCCDLADTICNGGDWDASLDPIWEYGYRRFRYRYDLGSSSITVEP